jgi:hypothetical protein
VQVAQAAGTQAIDAFQAQMPYMAGPGYGGAMASAINALGQGKEVPEGTFRPEMFTAPAPDLQQQARDATMEALKLISPTAAQATGTPLPQLQGLDIAGMLGRTTFAGAGQQQAPAPAAAGGGQQQPITINIGGAQAGQQPGAPEVPPPFVPRSPLFQQAPGIGPQLPPQVTPLGGAVPGAFPPAFPGAPTAPGQFTPAGGAGGYADPNSLASRMLRGEISQEDMWRQIPNFQPLIGSLSSTIMPPARPRLY